MKKHVNPKKDFSEMSKKIIGNFLDENTEEDNIYHDVLSLHNCS